MGGKTFSVMSEAEIEKRLLAAKKATGVPVKDLRRMCLLGGLELLEEGKLVIRKKAENEEVSV